VKSDSDGFIPRKSFIRFSLEVPQIVSHLSNSPQKFHKSREIYPSSCSSSCQDGLKSNAEVSSIDGKSWKLRHPLLSNRDSQKPRSFEICSLSLRDSVSETKDDRDGEAREVSSVTVAFLLLLYGEGETGGSSSREFLPKESIPRQRKV